MPDVPNSSCCCTTRDAAAKAARQSVSAVVEHEGWQQSMAGTEELQSSRCKRFVVDTMVGRRVAVVIVWSCWQVVIMCCMQLQQPRQEKRQSSPQRCKDNTAYCVTHCNAAYHACSQTQAVIAYDVGGADIGVAATDPLMARTLTLVPVPLHSKKVPSDKHIVRDMN